ncbi:MULTISPECIES: OadG family protein [Marinobacter]|uniref:Probable oxaloacetate decarboxylase gamma chain n=1 Tax=Marinobacter xiaoshiensis TaxID=3073652 RepID=A0ABU2HHS0_9GAMM|nr:MULTISPECIES: OadG family protein [unclassified Marinobacter]MBK1874382.1 OadG family protein [Marinobacter sp. 1-3A]MBK1887557.1 OadG family protein [Marinobacter sp. DY40_1A1]MDS1310166.1 OadG family protein [Marinobacter sp. F60267]
MDDLMSQAVDLMVAGMGFVFVFLIILVFATMLMSKLLIRFAPPEPVTPAKKPRAKPKAPVSVDPDTAEAIKQAIAKFRSRHKK